MKQYLDLLEHVIENGSLKGDRTGTGTKSVFGYQVKYDLEKGFPLLTTKKIHWKSVVAELLWFLRGDTNIRTLQDQGVSIWNEWADSNGDLKNVYGAQWRRWETANNLDLVLVDKKICVHDNSAFKPTLAQTLSRIRAKNIIVDERWSDKTFVNQLGQKFWVKGTYYENNIETKKLVVEFENTNTLLFATERQVSNKTIKDPYFSSICNVACLGKETSIHWPQRNEALKLWKELIGKCFDKNHSLYSQYGGRGIGISNEWKCFENFLYSLNLVPYFSNWKANPSQWRLDIEYWGSNGFSAQTCMFVCKQSQKEIFFTQAIKIQKEKNTKYYPNTKSAAIALGVGQKDIRNWLNNKNTPENIKITSVASVNQLLTPLTNLTVNKQNYENVYPKLIRKKIVSDQVGDVLDSINNNPNNRGMIISGWNVSDLPDMALRPCHTLYQWNVVDNRLDCHLYQRSGDAFLGVPFNMASCALWIHIMARITNLQPGTLTHSFGDLHIYSNHMDQVKEQLSRKPGKLAQIVISEDLKTFEDFTNPELSTDKFKLEGYNPAPAIRAPVAV